MPRLPKSGCCNNSRALPLVGTYLAGGFGGADLPGRVPPQWMPGRCVDVAAPFHAAAWLPGDSRVDEDGNPLMICMG